MSGSQRTSSGVLGPLGLLLVVVLWLVTMASNAPATNSTQPTSRPAQLHDPLALINRSAGNQPYSALPLARLPRSGA